MSLTSDHFATRNEAAQELLALAHDVAAVAALAQAGRTAEDVMAAWTSLRGGGALLAVTGALARWRTLESYYQPAQQVDGKTRAAGGRHDD